MNEFKKWVREVINTQAQPNGNAMLLDDFKEDGFGEYSYPKEFFVNGIKFWWSMGYYKTRGKGMSSHFEIWLHSTGSFSERVATGELTLAKIRKGLKMIYERFVREKNEEDQDNGI